MFSKLFPWPPALRHLGAVLLRLLTLCLRPFLFALPFVLRTLVGSPKGTQLTSDSLLLGAVADLARSKTELILENALRRQQLIVLRRQIQRPQLTNTDRTLMVRLASKLRAWKSALRIVQPGTLLRGHRAGFRLLRKIKSSPNSPKRTPKLPAETIELIKQLAQANRLWGAERIRGELRKPDIRVAKRTIQKYMRVARAAEPTRGTNSQTWSTFLHNHAAVTGACDFLQVYDLFFRPLFIFCMIELSTRRVVHFRVTRNPSDEWTAQQLREATPYGEQPQYLIRDNDRKFGPAFRRVARASSIKEWRIAYKAPKMNSFCERFHGSVQRECLDEVLVLGERHLHTVVQEYVEYFNAARPHQGINQVIPQGAHLQEAEPTRQIPAPELPGKLTKFPSLGGLHHDYRRAA